MKIGIYTLGCKVNQYETQAMEQELTARGHELVDFESPADAYIINTCSVTAVSDKKSRQMIRRAKKNSPDAVVAACGCYVQTHEEEAKSLGIDLLMGTNDRARFLDRLEEAVKTREAVADIDDALRRRTFEVLPAGGMANRTRAMLKVEDGCVNFCTYCIIPYARGPVRSLPMDKAAEQVRALRSQGYRELVVTGIEISSYGHDLKDGTTLIDLLELIAREGGEMRIRLGSLEPRTVTREFCERAKKLPTLCPHFHLSMQSGCDATLRRMNRRYDTARYYESVELLREYFDDPAITTDLIVGFPGETDDDFEELVEFVKWARFERMGAFAYSEEDGTYAALHYADDVPDDVKQSRLDRLMAVQQEISEQLAAKEVGKTVRVMVDRKEGDFYVGRTESSSPEVDPEVLIPAEDKTLDIGAFCQVHITASDEFDLYGKAI